MYDCLPSINLHPQWLSGIPKFGVTPGCKLPNLVKFSIPGSNWHSTSVNSTRYRDAIPFPSDEREYEDLDFGLLEKEKDGELRLRRERKGMKHGPEMAEPAAIDEAAEELSIGGSLKFRGEKKDNELEIATSEEPDVNLGGLEGNHNRGTINPVTRRQMMRRSNVMAKQVISIRSALSLGFVSQLWVDPSSWVVVVVEVKPNLLSGDSDKFLLKEITRVGDVILVEDENAIEDELKLVGLETLVGYSVVTPRRQNIGKVRGYTFNINSGMVESLELDSFGISIIPSSLVSTYALLLDDVVDVYSDTVVVRDAAVSRLQRLTKGFWDGQTGISDYEFEEQADADRHQDYADYSKKRRKSRKPRPKKPKSVDDWELPMDFL